VRWLLALALLRALGCGRSGKIAEDDLAKLRPEWTMKEVIKAFGPGRGTEFPAYIYPAWGSDDQYLFFFDERNGGRLTEVRRLNAATKDQVLVWPP